MIWYVQSHFEWAKLWYTSLIVSPCMVAHHATKEGLYSRIAQSCQVHWSNQWLTLGDSVIVRLDQWGEMQSRKGQVKLAVELNKTVRLLFTSLLQA